MQIFKTFFIVSKKYVTSFFIYTGIFLTILTMMAASQSKSSETTFEASAVDLAIFDHDSSSLSKALSEYLSKSNKLITIDEDENSIKNALYQRKVYYVLIIPDGFEENVKNGKTNTLDSYKINSQASIFLDTIINKYVSVYASYADNNMSDDELLDKTNETVTTQTQVSMLTKDTEEFSEIHFFFIFMPYILVSVITISIAQVLLAFNKPVLKKRMQCSCNKDVYINIMQGLASLIYALLISGVFIAFSFVKYGNAMLSDIGALRIANTLVTAFVSLGFAFLIASLITKPQFVTMLANIYGLASSFLCGVFVDRALLGKGVILFGRFFPSSWYVDIETILSKNDSLSSLSSGNIKTLATGFVVQILFAGTFFVLGLITSKYRKRLASFS